MAQIGSPASGGRGRKAKGAKAKGTAGLRAAAAPAMDAADQALRSQLLCLFDLLATLRKVQLAPLFLFTDGTFRGGGYHWTIR